MFQNNTLIGINIQLLSLSKIDSHTFFIMKLFLHKLPNKNISGINDIGGSYNNLHPLDVKDDSHSTKNFTKGKLFKSLVIAKNFYTIVYD